MSTGGPVQVMVVDDSATVRKVLGDLLRAAAGIELLATAADPLFALEKMRKHWPDVVVLDIEMPRMDGLTFLRQLMAMRPTPVVICSSLTESGARLTMEALAAGAVDVICKPRVDVSRSLVQLGGELVQAVRAAARANVRRTSLHAATRLPEAAPTLAPAHLGVHHRMTDQVVAIGTSTGGTQALEFILRGLPKTLPGILIVQHMPEKFTAAFAERLDKLCALNVREAVHGERVLPGDALIAPGRRHMALRRSGAQYFVDVTLGPPVNRHCPSVDVLFRSVAKAAGCNALGIILTGMGDDGARGLLEMRQAQAETIAEHESTCIVHGMPKEAVRLGAAQAALPLPAVPQAILRFARGNMG